MWDSVTLSEAVRHHSTYGYVAFYTLIASALAPFVSAYTIKDGEDGENGKYIFLTTRFGLFLLCFQIIIIAVLLI